ncbi:acid type B receptor subunit [Seminavis robusta]|uniref:Acid type B receptor subunit n=1 Tax=Seminavis robusta TaxID=568900 RepID=A0A9N8EYF1_9STRA|nr:acid type B receptor subunit [Seminavis robusta]|eukprot:Sro2541_g330660.1 acid type B receptor subunit (388) ;mRNA; f:752-1985
MNYMQEWWVSIGILLVVLQFVFSILFSAWTFCYREHPIIKASQPQFLWMIAFGCCVMVTAIIPMLPQGEYRHVQNPLTSRETNIPKPEIIKLDAACMALPWMACLGFTIIFSALFAKIWRIKKIHSHAERFRRQEVIIRDVISIMVVMLVEETAVLLTWSLVDPLQWNRTVLTEDADGYPIESAGSCSSDSTVYFLSTLAVFKEGRWIALCVYSIFQYLIIGIPVLVIASDDRDATFFVMSVGLILVSATVTFLIFGPKLWKFIWMDPNNPMDMSLVVRKFAMRSSTIPNPQYGTDTNSHVQDYTRSFATTRASQTQDFTRRAVSTTTEKWSPKEPQCRGSGVSHPGEFENNDSEPDNVEMALQPLECASNDDAEDDDGDHDVPTGS